MTSISQGSGDLFHDLKLNDSYLIKRLISWGGFATLCWACRWFSPVVAGTFFFTIIGNSFVELLTKLFYSVQRRLEFLRGKKISRKIFVGAYFVLLALGLLRLFLFVTPRVIKETSYVVSILQSEDPYDLSAKVLQSTFGSGVVSRLESVILQLIGESGRVLSGYDSIATFDQGRRLGKLLQYSFMGYLQSILSFSSRVISNSSQIAYKTILSLIFSLMVILLNWRYQYIHSYINIFFLFPLCFFLPNSN
jgi:hypothetical protein